MFCFLQVFSVAFTEKSKNLNDCVWLRKTAAIIMIVSLGVSNVLDMVSVKLTLYLDTKDQSAVFS